MQFQQAPPGLGNQYEDDRVLRSYLSRVLPNDVFRDVGASLAEMGRLSGAELYEFQLADRLNEPTLTQWDAWGNRVDRIELTPLWRLAERIAAEHGVVATAYEQKHGSLSRVHQCALKSLHAVNRHLQLSTCDDRWRRAHTTQFRQSGVDRSCSAALDRA